MAFENDPLINGPSNAFMSCKTLKNWGSSSVGWLASTFSANSSIKPCWHDGQTKS